jgi:hypothetical protein
VAVRLEAGHLKIHPDEHGAMLTGGHPTL